MSEIIKKEIASAVKWTFVILIAATAYYMVVPKYQMRDKERTRFNTSTGELVQFEVFGNDGKALFSTDY